MDQRTLDTPTIIDAIEAMTPDDLRRRIGELDGQAEYLRTLLRAALARERRLHRKKREEVVA